MPQIFQILRCFKCMVFQVHQTKKSNKWECKLCGEKQSVKRHYGLGIAKDCRLHVQKLNGIKGKIDELKNNDHQDSENSENEDIAPLNTKKNHHTIKNSKWSNYIEEIEQVEQNCNDNMTIGYAEIVLEIPKKRRKQYNSSFTRNPITSFDHNKPQEIYKTENNSSPNKSTQSSTLYPEVHSGNLIEKKEIPKIYKNVTKNKFIPPVLNRNSKWAQFTEHTEENEEVDIAPSLNIKSSQKDFLFSLCDDTDLDDVLNI